MTGKSTPTKSRRIKPAKGQNLGIGKFMAGMLAAGKSTEDVLEAVRKKFPGSTASSKDVSLIRGRLRRGDFDAALTERVAKQRKRVTKKSVRTRSRSRKK